MSESPDQDILSTEFCRERSVRRTATVLEAKRQRIRDEIQQLISHVALLVPAGTKMNDSYSYADLLQDAAKRLGDDAFAQLLVQILQEGSSSF